MVKASDPTDSFKRDWLIIADQVPIAPDWTKNADTEIHGSGDVMSRDLTLTDGKHKVYFVVSQSGGVTYGKYSGDIQFDTKSAHFDGVDEYSPVGFNLDVKDNAVVSESSTAAASSTTDKATAFVKKYWKQIAGGAAGLSIIGGLVAWKGKGHSRRL